MGTLDDPVAPPQKLQLPLTESILSPTLPVFLLFPNFPDSGNLYHHLPWFEDKPVAAVTSHWEDAGHRWDSLNHLRALGQHLVRPQS